jgi:hypothetical protein
MVRWISWWEADPAHRLAYDRLSVAGTDPDLADDLVEAVRVAAPAVL